MNKLVNIFCTLAIVIWQYNLGICQTETKSISAPFVELTNNKLKYLLDTIFTYEKKCIYYNDSLLLGINIRQDPENKKIYSLQFETQTDKHTMFRSGPLGVLAYFEFEEHICLIYYHIPDDLFTLTDCTNTFYYQYNSSKCNTNINVGSFENDKFSQWLYYFYDNEFHFYARYSNCDN